MEQVTVTPENLSDPEAEAAANAAALERAQSSKDSFSPPEAPVTEPTGSPEVPEKFRNADGSVNTEALLKSYTHLESKLGSTEKTPEAAPVEPTEAPETAEASKDDLTIESAKTEDPEATPEDAAEAATEAAGLNMEALQAHYAAQGELSEEHYESFEKAGIGKEFVDAYIAGQEALNQLRTADIFQQVGGEDNYRSMVQWASANVSQADAAAFDAAVTQGSPADYNMALTAMKARYEAANGTGSPQTRVTGSAAPAATDGFASKREQIEAMKDPRYKEDPAYQAEVFRKTRLMVASR